ncbi:MAG: pantoate--beta-alanine ligase [Bacilli bacterium]|nr:pantoate--beta-alanine ligase [Bacilli bacterium]
MQLIETIAGLREVLAEARRQGLKVGLVPTMGYLHEGHASLITRAKEECDVVVVSVFVNPLQFGPHEDLDRYPRDLERDAQLATKSGAAILFHPSAQEMYPSQVLTTVSVQQVTDRLCGASRPGHFDGVATVVLKLLNIVLPDRVYFGLKDYQQVRVISRMVSDLNVPVQIVPCPTIREPDGLAKSSRNVYLTAQDRQAALVLSNSLRELQKLVSAGERNAALLQSRLTEWISSEPLARIDYVEILDSEKLEPVSCETAEIVAAVAVYFGQTRLIDNAVIDAEGRPFYAADSNEIKNSSRQGNRS